jgi:phage tail protein X
MTYPTPPSQGLLYTAKGDRWDNIAYAMYGDPTQVESLIQNNPGVPVADYVAAGTPLFVPLIEVSTTSTSSTPWG